MNGNIEYRLAGVGWVSIGARSLADNVQTPPIRRDINENPIIPHFIDPKIST
jgi:hypothetical protein